MSARPPNACLGPGCTLLALIAMVLVSGCSEPFDHLRFEVIGPIHGLIVLEDTRIHVQRGSVVAFKVHPIDRGNGEMDTETRIVLQPLDPRVLGSYPLRLDDPTGEADDDDLSRWAFLFVGVSAGETVVQVYVDGVLQLEIPASVE